MSRLANKVAIVTGATTVEPGGLNIGGATATELVAEGARVVLADINIEGASALADQLNQKYGPDAAIAVAHRSSVRRGASAHWSTPPSRPSAGCSC